MVHMLLVSRARFVRESSFCLIKSCDGSTALLKDEGNTNSFTNGDLSVRSKKALTPQAWMCTLRGHLFKSIQAIWVSIHFTEVTPEILFK